MWDIAGKAAGKPVWALLGGRVHERLRAYTYLYPAEGGRGFLPRRRTLGGRGAAELRAGLHRGQVRPGRRLLRLRPAPTVSDQLERRALPAHPRRGRTRADLLFGTHGQFTASGAIRMAKRLEPFDPLWFEEPTPPEMPEEMAKVARHPRSRSPPASGWRPSTSSPARSPPAGSIIQINLGRCGGLLEGEEDRRPRRGPLRPDRPAPLLRPDGGCCQHPARHHPPQLPHPREHPGLGRLSRRTPEDNRSASRPAG